VQIRLKRSGLHRVDERAWSPPRVDIFGYFRNLNLLGGDKKWFSQARGGGRRVAPTGSDSSGKSLEYFEKLSLHPSQSRSRVYTGGSGRWVGGLVGGSSFDPRETTRVLHNSRRWMRPWWSVTVDPSMFGPPWWTLRPGGPSVWFAVSPTHQVGPRLIRSGFYW